MPYRKTLTILRHAKAESGSATQDDHDRALTERGQVAATAIGNFMARHHMAFDLVLCSTSRRTRQTFDQLQIEPAPPVEYSERLYLASANEIISVLAQTPVAVKDMLLIGHNPGLQQLCLKLSKHGDEDLIDTMAIKFPTCALATIAIGENWQDVLQPNGELLEFLTPKALALQEDN